MLPTMGDVKGEMDPMQFVEVKIENIAETDDASTSSEVHGTELGEFEEGRYVRHVCTSFQ